MIRYRKPSIVLAMILTAVAARGGLLLTGNTAGLFQPISNHYATMTNSVDGSNSSFRPGLPVENSFKSGVQFNGSNFQNIGDGDTFSLGLVTYYNGLSRIGTSSGTSSLDFYLNFDDPAVGRIYLATVKFGIDATANTASRLTPDIFTASFLQPRPIWVGDELVKFTINGLPTSTSVAENAWVNLGNVTVTVAIPEISTYAVLLGMVAMGFATLRRRYSGTTEA